MLDYVNVVTFLTTPLMNNPTTIMNDQNLDEKSIHK